MKAFEGRMAFETGGDSGVGLRMAQAKLVGKQVANAIANDDRYVVRNGPGTRERFETRMKTPLDCHEKQFPK